MLLSPGWQSTDEKAKAQQENLISYCALYRRTGLLPPVHFVSLWGVTIGINRFAVGCVPRPVRGDPRIGVVSYLVAVSITGGLNQQCLKCLFFFTGVLFEKYANCFNSIVYNVRQVRFI